MAAVPVTNPKLTLRMTTIIISESNFNKLCLKRCPKRKQSPTDRSNSFSNQHVNLNTMFETIVGYYIKLP